MGYVCLWGTARPLKPWYQTGHHHLHFLFDVDFCMVFAFYHSSCQKVK